MSLRHRLGRALRGVRDRFAPPDEAAVPHDEVSVVPSADRLGPEDVRLDAHHVLHQHGIGVDIVFVDVRARPDGTVPGALHLPADAAVARRAEIPDGEALVLICDDGTLSTEVALRLRDHGVPAFALHGGLAAWRRAGGEVEPA